MSENKQTSDEHRHAGWLQELFDKNTETQNVRKKVIIIGESGGKVSLDKKESQILATILRDWRDPKNILEV